MFTGIVEELGIVADLGAGIDGRRLRIDASLVLEDASRGSSIAVNGCCLTVVDWGSGGSARDRPSWWEADVTPETLARTNLGALRAGDPVNLERPLRLADRLGGHLVQGHVDAVGEIVEGAPVLRVRTPRGLHRFVVEKGSVTVDGVSLTVVDALEDGFTVAVIPHTAAVTTLGTKVAGDGVNVEVDVVAKHVARHVATYVSRYLGPFVERLSGTGRGEEA